MGERQPPGDPPKAARVIFDAVAGGPNESLYFGLKLERLKADYEKTKELAKTTDRDDAK